MTTAAWVGFGLLALAGVAAFILESALALGFVALLIIGLVVIATDKFQRLRISGPGRTGLEVEKQKQEQEIQEATTEIAESTTPPVEGEPSDAEKVAEVRRRESIEKLMRSSAGWGWTMAKMGFSTVPSPVIKWNSDGEPEIMYGRGGGPQEEDF